MPTTNYVWDPLNDSYLMETDGVGTTTAVYTQEPSRYGGLVSQRQAGATSYFHQDHLGSTRLLTDETGTVTDTFAYDAWGNEVVRTGSTETPFRWVGESGYYFNPVLGAFYIRARNYSPVISRWQSVDPRRFDDDRRNSYRYVRNSPLNALDPSGECTVCGSGKRYRTSIADLDSLHPDKPYEKLAEAIRVAQNGKHSAVGVVWPPFTSAGPAIRKNAKGVKIMGTDVPPGTFAASAFLFFVDWDICEKDGPCDLYFEETLTVFPDIGQKQSISRPRGDITGGHDSIIANRVPPAGGCDKTIIFADAPGTIATLIDVPGLAVKRGVSAVVTIKLQIVDRKTQKVVDTQDVNISWRINTDGTLDATP